MAAISLMTGTDVCVRCPQIVNVEHLLLFVQVYLEELVHPDQLDGELNLAPGFLLLFIISS